MKGATILIVDDEQLIRWSVGEQLKQAGYRIVEAETVAQGWSMIVDQCPDAVLLDQALPDATGLELLSQMKTEKIVAPVIMLTGIDKSDVAVKAMKLGAFDYVTKPVDLEELIVVIEKALEATRMKRQLARLSHSGDSDRGFCGMMGTSPAMVKVYNTIASIAPSKSTTVLITGESGTGKELAARAVHSLSDRAENPMMTVNISALPDTLIESELFGHERGAFTDARTQKKGLFELSDGGTVFLDEIGDVPLRVQVKLLRVLDQKTFRRLGGENDITADVRIVAATNRPLEKMIAEATFRQDLFYRLNVAAIHLPPVHERGTDCIHLAEYFLDEFNTAFKKDFLGLAEETKTLFRSYRWPGNVREIRNVIERVALIGSGGFVTPDMIDLHHFSSIPEPRVVSGDPYGSFTSNSTLADLEKSALIRALETANQNQSQAAKLLAISRDTLRYRLKKYDLLR